jgi:membrane protease YdiL (CAAX protease family)
MPPATSVRRVIIAGLFAVLIGATLFGLWHLIVGGLLNGNPRAGTFGFLLAAVAGSFLGGLAVGLRRLRPG